MVKVSKEFWVSDEHLDKINSDGEFSLILRNKDESSFMDSVINKATNKITISYEIDREIKIKESELEKMCDELYLGTAKFKNTPLYFKLKEGFFGGGENE